MGDAALRWGRVSPSPWEMTFQEAVTPVMEYITWFHNWLLVIITLITLFVLALLADRHRRASTRAANPTPSRTTHNTLIEVAWTLIPVIILVAIAVPSFKLLFLQTHDPGRPTSPSRRPASSGTGATPIRTPTSSSTR